MDGEQSSLIPAFLLNIPAGCKTDLLTLTGMLRKSEVCQGLVDWLVLERLQVSTNILVMMEPKLLWFHPEALFIPITKTLKYGRKYYQERLQQSALILCRWATS